jgi:hypothetical protein
MECLGLWHSQRVEVACGVTAEHHLAGGSILDRKTSRVKFNGYIVITGELLDRNKVLD